MTETHVVERTSPKGQAFVGVCVKCGERNLPITAARDVCTNPANLSQREVMDILVREKGAFQ